MLPLFLPLLGVLTVACFAIAAYDHKLQLATSTLAELSALLSDQSGKITAMEQAQTEAAQREKQFKEALDSAKQVAADQQKFYPPQSDMTAPAAPSSALDDLYNPEDQDKDKQAELDRLKKRYEEIFINNMFMKKCGKAKPADIHIIISALSQDMASINAPGRLQYDILNSARGSYREMYADSPCESDAAKALEAHYSQYIDSLTGRLNDQ